MAPHKSLFCRSRVLCGGGHGQLTTGLFHRFDRTLAFVFTNLYDGVGLEEIIRFILDKGMLDERRPQAEATAS